MTKAQCGAARVAFQGLSGSKPSKRRCSEAWLNSTQGSFELRPIELVRAPSLRENMVKFTGLQRPMSINNDF